jgi:glycosyltransferase involved in cell wall biosynthesis
MKILIAEASTAIGGQELAVVRHAKGMRKRGHDVQLLVQPGSPIEQLALQQEVPIQAVEMSGLTPSALKMFRQILRRERPDILHVNSSRDSWLGGIAARLLSPRVKVIKTRHISAPLNRNAATRLLYRRLFDHIIVTGGRSNERALVERDGLQATKVSAFPIGVDLSQFSPGSPEPDIRGELGLAPGDRLVGLLSYLRAYKGHQYFIEAAALLAHRHPGVRFLIVGEGPDEMSIRARIAQLGVAREVLMLGYRPDSLSLLRSLDIFVMPSIEGDTIPQVLLEAMAVGLPVVATTTGSIPDVIGNGLTGLLVPPRESQAISECVETLLNDAALRRMLGHNASCLVARTYSLESMLDCLERVYQQVLAQDTNTSR